MFVLNKKRQKEISPSSAIRAEIGPSFNQSHYSADFSQPIIFNHRIQTANEF
jgi:hypothetical protein